MAPCRTTVEGLHIKGPHSEAPQSEGPQSEGPHSKGPQSEEYYECTFYCRRTDSRLSSSDSCDVEAELFDVELYIVKSNSGSGRDRGASSGDLKMLAGQDKVEGVKGEEAIMTARTSDKPKT
jgi:hypothetical protein